MPAIFHSKHQKLILQCYPPGKGTEKKPNSSELSYLLYYASTRRVKLEKVITFLNRKARSDSSKNKSGNLQVTLNIVSALIEKCSDNLDVFAPESVSILDLALKNNDLHLVKAVLETYGMLCTHLDGDLFAGDKQFVDSFSSFSHKLINVGMNNSKSNTPNSLEWKMVSLMACKYVSGCLGYNVEFGKEFLNKTMPILITTFNETDKKNSLLALKSNDGESMKLKKVQLSKSARLQQQIDDDLENDDVDIDDLYDESVAALNSIFNTSLSSLLIDGTDQVVMFTFKANLDSEWKLKFLQLCTSWVPVQLRFVVLTTLVSRLSKLSNDDKLNFDLQKHIANNILGLLKSKVNMIGLSISDLIQNMLDITQNLYFKQIDKILEDQVQQLSRIYEDIVLNLSTHIYYFDQVPDSIYEIFFKVESTLEDADEAAADKVYNFVLVLLDVIANIFDNLVENPSKSTINRNHIGIENWLLSLILLQSKGHGKLYSSLSAEQASDIQLSYLQLFDTFLTKELVASEGLNDSQAALTMEFLNPDYNQLISQPTNFLSTYLVYLNHCMASEDLDPSNANGFLIISNHLISIFGINFLHNFIPFFFHWSIQDILQDVPENLLTRDNFGQTLLKNCLKIINNKYPDQVGDYVVNSPFYKHLTQNIAYKMSNDLWMEEFVPITSSSSSDGRQYTELTAKDMQEFISGNEFLNKWLDAQKPLVLNVLTEDLTSESSHNNGSNKKENGHYTQDTQSANGHLAIDSSTSYSGAPNGGGHEFRSGLGLGNTADIASINSGLRNANTSYNTINGSTSYANGDTSYSNGHSNGAGIHASFDHSNTSIATTENKAPKVRDIKDLLSDHNKLETRDESTRITPGSVLSKQMATQNVDTILDDLDDDDSFIV